MVDVLRAMIDEIIKQINFLDETTDKDISNVVLDEIVVIKDGLEVILDGYVERVFRRLKEG